MKRFLVSFILILFLFLSVIPALASSQIDLSNLGAYQFGYTQAGGRNFAAGNNEMGFAPAWFSANLGTSYSQPLVLDGQTMGTPNGLPAVVVVSGLNLYGFDSLSPERADAGRFSRRFRTKRTTVARPDTWHGSNEVSPDPGPD